MRTKTRLTTLLAALAATIAVGCGGSDNPNPDAEPDPDPDPDPDPAAACDLRLSKSIEEHGGPGGTATYEVTVDNMGGTECEAPVTVTDSLPPHVSYASTSASDWACTVVSSNPEEVECEYDNGSLPASASTTFALEVDIGERACMSTNCATASNGEEGAGSEEPAFDDTPENNRDCAGVQCGQSEDNCVEPPSGMVGWWTADQTVEDASVEGNDGMEKNGLYYTTGQVLESFGLDGRDDHVEVADDSSLDVAADGAISIDAWVHPTQTEESVYTIVDKRAEESAGNVGYALQIRSNTLIVRLQGGSTDVTYSSSGSVPAGEWTHVTVTANLDDDTGTLYLNGTQDGTFSPSSTNAGSLENDSPLYIGRDFKGENHFDGRIDEVEIFDRVLTSSEVASLFRVGPCGKCRVACEEGEATMEAGGIDDDFQSDDPASPSQYLTDNYGPLKGFDDDATNQQFGHTFTDLKPELKYKQICGAELEIRAQPSGTTQDTNDTIVLTTSDGAGNRFPPLWRSRLGGSGGLTSDAWDSDSKGPDTFTLDLANLSGSGGNTTNLLPAIDDHQMLNVRVQDDTEVDYLILRLEYCCDDDQEPSGEPDVAVSKQAEGDITTGQTSTYTIGVENVGDDTAQPPTEVTDTVPECMEIEGIQSPWDSWCSVSGQQVTCNYPDPLGPGATAPDLKVDVVASEECGDLAENCAEVSHPEDGNADNDRSCDESEVTRAEADLSIEKSALGEGFTVDQEGTWELTVTNNGPSEAQGPITVTDDLPACVEFDSASPSAWTCNTSGGEVTCEHPDSLAAGQSRTLELSVAVSRECGDLLENCARVSAASPSDPNEENDSTCVSNEVQHPHTEADLGIEKTHSGKLDMDANNTYTISVTNDGPTATSSSFDVTDELPSCMEFVSVSPSSDWSCNTGANNKLTCTYSDPISNGATVDMELEVHMSEGCGVDQIQNCARVEGQNDPNAGNDEACDASYVNF